MKQAAFGSSANIYEQNVMNYSNEINMSPLGYQQQAPAFQGIQMAYNTN